MKTTTIVPLLREILDSNIAEAEYPLIGNQNLDDYLKKIETYAETVVWQSEDEIKGFIAFYCNDPEKVAAYITMVIVKSNCRGQGIGNSLIQLVINTARQRKFQFCRLQVHRDNSAASSVYERCGFKVIESQEEYLMMELKL